jgi:hypothetical protein
MKAEQIKSGDKYVNRDERGRETSGWTATGDAVVEDGQVYVAVRHHDGGDGVRVFSPGTEVPVN